MPIKLRFTSISFSNYKAFKKFSVTLGSFNVLVGPNNSGKSTIIGVFRILAEGIRKARTRKPEYIHHEGHRGLGYRISLDGLPISTENVFTDYDDSAPAIITFLLSNGNEIRLKFFQTNICYMVCVTNGMEIRSPAGFKKDFNVNVDIVPILGPVEDNEPLYQLEAARQALMTHRASRNFRNIWYHFPEGFDAFRELVSTTWPGMDIEKPSVRADADRPILLMFCPEERYPREIYWAGFGFQVWCQMLTYILWGQNSTLLIIDEPDIYLHSDLQRQLLGLLRNIDADILIATHSTEIISEADVGELLVINKKETRAKRIKNLGQVYTIFKVLGSNLNPTLTQLAKSQRAIFVEGNDFQILSSFARRLGIRSVANRSGFAVIPVEGFNPTKAKDFTKGIEMALDAKLLVGVIFDSDYRTESKIIEVHKKMKSFSFFTHIHTRKEIENYLFVPEALKRAINKGIAEYNRRTDSNLSFDEDIHGILDVITEEFKSGVESQFLNRRQAQHKSESPGTDRASIFRMLLDEFETKYWNDPYGRLIIVPGKEVLSRLNRTLQAKYKLSLTPLLSG